jgi:hypothetical protein
MSADPKKKRLRLIDKDRGRELRSAIMEWGLRGMSKAQARKMARSFDLVGGSADREGRAFQGPRGF